MPQETSTTQIRITPRRSKRRLRKQEAIRAEPSSQKYRTSGQHSSLHRPTSKFLELSPEIRIFIFSHLITTERPFMIGRCQEERRKIQGSPRDIFTYNPNTPFKVQRDESRSRPVQPSVTRVCRTFREEALPLWYANNHFWLIHNEFEPENEAPSPHRGFNAWISQTPREMFNFMQNVSLCCYSGWPNRMMILVDLKNKNIDNVRRYSTYGDELPTFPEDFVDPFKRILASKADEDGFAALKALLVYMDPLFSIPRTHMSVPPGMMRRKPASGWEYDW